MLSSLDLFKVRSVQRQIEKDIVREYHPISNISSGAPIEFHVNTAANEYTALSETKLYVRVKVTLKHASKSAITSADWAKVKLSNNVLGNLFKNVELSMNGKDVSQTSSMYGYRSYLENLIGYSPDSKQSYLSACGWIRDETARAKLLNITNNIATAELIGKIHLDLTFQGRHLPGGLPLHLKLYPQDPKFMFNISDKDLSVDVAIDDAILFAHHAKVSRDTLVAHMGARKDLKLRYPITRVELNSHGISTGFSDKRIDNIFSGYQPRRVFMMLVTSAAFNGTYEHDPLVFKDHKLSEISLFVDGEQVQRGLKMKFSEERYLEAYDRLFSAVDMDSVLSKMEIDRFSFKDKFVIYAFNLSPDCSHGEGMIGYTSEPALGHMNVRLVFEEPLKETLTLITYAEFDSAIFIDSFNTVTTDFN